jgi:mannose-6-phosphate isomerase-like protein (cupin superfamily)
MYNNSFEKENPYIIYNLRAASLLTTTPYQNLWSAENMLVTLQTLEPGVSFPMTMHPDMDELISVTQGQGRILMGDKIDEIKYDSYFVTDSVIFIPAGMWHKIINQYIYPLIFVAIQTKCNNQLFEQNI